jgi:hypothetical protein
MAKTKRTSQFARYIAPVIEAIRELGGSGRPDEVRVVVAAIWAFRMRSSLNRSQVESACAT